MCSVSPSQATITLAAGISKRGNELRATSVTSRRAVIYREHLQPDPYRFSSLSQLCQRASYANRLKSSLLVFTVKQGTRASVVFAGALK